MGGQNDAVLKWDAEKPNGFTSKTFNWRRLRQVRTHFERQRDYLVSHRDELMAQRKEEGIGDVGVINGVYVEEIKKKMPKDWPPLVPCTRPEMITGVYLRGDGVLWRSSIPEERVRPVRCTV